jgi:hypothetical protein
VRDRTLLWDGCLNVRDLGGHPTEDGRETRWRRIVRADSVRQLSDEGWASCQGGKDRTGLVVALLLRLARVPIDEIAADYAISEERLADDSAPWIAEAENDRDRTLRTRIVAAPADAMRLVLEELERRDGGVTGYLGSGGASVADLELVRSRLVG